MPETAKKSILRHPSTPLKARAQDSNKKTCNYDMQALKKILLYLNVLLNFDSPKFDLSTRVRKKSLT